MDKQEIFKKGDRVRFKGYRPSGKIIGTVVITPRPTSNTMKVLMDGKKTADYEYQRWFEKLSENDASVEQQIR